MRSVKAQRKSRGAVRTKPNRRGENAKRPPAERVVLSKKKPARDGFFTRVRDSLPEIGMPRRPILHLTWLLLLAAFIAALFAGGYVSGAFKSVGRGVNAVIADAGFGIASVHLAGNGRTQPSEILAALGFEPGQPIFGADVQAARQRLLQLPWVADAEVRRQYPDSIAVSLVEKLPFALWQMPAGTFVVERSGRVIIKTNASAFPHLPVFMGDGAPDVGAELVDADRATPRSRGACQSHAARFRPALESSSRRRRRGRASRNRLAETARRARDPDRRQRRARA